MKNIMDAVNTFRAKFPDSWFLAEDKSGAIIGLSYGVGSKTDNDLIAICGEKQFNALVKELSGCPIALAEWQASKNDIDWSETECTYALVNNKDAVTCFFINKPKLTNCKGYYKTTSNSTLYNTNHWEIKKRPQPKPTPLIYTQEMADKGELPSVGMECMVTDFIYDNKKSFKGVILFVGIEFIIWFHGGTEYCQNKSELKFEPIDTKTNKEKAIDDLKEFFNQEKCWTHKSLIQAVIDGNIHGVKWIGE